MTTELWREVWRTGAPLLPTAGLEALAAALAEDAPSLIQKTTTAPPPLSVFADEPCEGACVVGYVCWKGFGLTTVAEVEAAFGEFAEALVRELEYRDPAPIRHLLQWADDVDRLTLRTELLPEVQRELERRREAVA